MLASSKLSSYNTGAATTGTTGDEQSTIKVDELNDKLRQSQQAVHERNKEIREKDKLIEELRRKMMGGESIKPIVMPEIIYKPSD
jgi:hypothetical protein